MYIEMGVIRDEFDLEFEKVRDETRVVKELMMKRQKKIDEGMNVKSAEDVCKNIIYILRWGILITM
jgi:hypothetical protein